MLYGLHNQMAMPRVAHPVPWVEAEPCAAGDEEMADGEAPKIGRQQLLYCERFVELLTDLLAQLPTRRLTAALLEDSAVLVKCRMSPLTTHPQGAPPSP